MSHTRNSRSLTTACSSCDITKAGFLVPFISSPFGLHPLKDWTHWSKHKKNQQHGRVLDSLIKKSSSCCTYFSWLVIIWIIPLLGIKSLRGDFYCAVFAFLQDFPEIVNSIACCTKVSSRLNYTLPLPMLNQKHTVTRNSHV